jgi:hypothetical protein
MSSQSLQLLRIEHKLDLIICALQQEGLMLEELPSLRGINSDICPVCREDTRVSADVINETYVRTCGCKPPTPLVPGISGVMTPPPTAAPYNYNKDNDNATGEPTETAGEG